MPEERRDRRYGIHNGELQIGLRELDYDVPVVLNRRQKTSVVAVWSSKTNGSGRVTLLPRVLPLPSVTGRLSDLATNRDVCARFLGLRQLNY
jgi:hypothetical protein